MGILLGSPLDSHQISHIREIFVQGLLANECRGEDATGAAVLGRDGRLWSAKAPVAARNFQETYDFSALLDQALTRDTSIVLGHNRKPTKGSVLNHHNNHPILSGDVVGIHNGVIENDEEIFASEFQNYRRLGSVDSEAVFALMNEISPHQPTAEFAAGVQNASFRLMGNCAALFFYRTRPGRLIVLKRGNPLSLHYEPEINALFFHSRYLFLRKCFGPVVTTEHLPSRSGFVFDARRLSDLGNRPVLAFRLPPPPDPPCGDAPPGQTVSKSL